MATDITLSGGAGEYMESATVVAWNVAPGATVKAGEVLVVVETAKAATEIEAPCDGVLIEIHADVGCEIGIGATLGRIGSSQEAPRFAPAEGRLGLEPRPADPAKRTAMSDPASERVTASPLARRLAAQHGIDLSHVTATGPRARIKSRDVERVLQNVTAQSKTAARPGAAIGAGLPEWPSVDFGKFGPVRRQPLTAIQKISGANLMRNWLMIPHVTNFDRADVTDLEEFRRRHNSEQRDSGANLTMVAFLIKASALTLREFPRFNTSLEGDELVLKQYVHISLAVDTPKGLTAPVIRDCDRKGFLEIASEVRELAAKARNGVLSPRDMQGGCFSVSSLGGVRGDGFTPIINAPEVAILGAGRSTTEAVWDGATFRPRLTLPISLSWDHRVVDGAAAALFLGHIASLLADASHLIL